MEILIKEIENKEQLEEWLKKAIKENSGYGGDVIFWMDDCFTKTPVLRVMEDWERHERMNYSFLYKGYIGFEWKSGKITNNFKDMIEYLYNYIKKNY